MHLCSDTHTHFNASKTKTFTMFQQIPTTKEEIPDTFHKKEAYNLDITVFLRIFALSIQEFLII